MARDTTSKLRGNLKKRDAQQVITRHDEGGAKANILDLDQQLCFALYRASRAVIRAYGPLLEPLGITYPQYLVLLVLWERDELLVKEIGERLSLDSATLTPLLKRLEHKKYIERKRNPADEREVYIRLTSEGSHLRDQALGVPRTLACAIGVDIENLSQMRKIATLRESLLALATLLEDVEQ